MQQGYLCVCVTDAEIIAELRRENAELRKIVEELRKEIEEWRRGHRERSKRRSSRAEGATRGGTGRGPGRPAGAKGSNRPVPSEIEREQEHPLPAECPACGGAVVHTGTQSTVVQDLPRIKVENVRHIGGIGRCESCKARVTSNLPGASNVGDAATQVQLGPGLVALALSLRFDEHVSLYGISRLFERWFGVQVTPSGLSHLFVRQQVRTAPAMTEIQTKLRQSPVVGIDETGLRQNGVAAWVWLLRSQGASLFRVELSRGAWVADHLLGENFSGTVCSDFYGVYTRRDDWLHA